MLQQQLMLAMMLVLPVWELKGTQGLGKGMMNLCQKNRTCWVQRRKLVSTMQLVMLLLLCQGTAANLQGQLICHQQLQKAELCSGIRGDDPPDHAPVNQSMASACVWTCVWCFCTHHLFSVSQAKQVYVSLMHADLVATLASLAPTCQCCTQGKLVNSYLHPDANICYWNSNDGRFWALLHRVDSDIAASEGRHPPAKNLTVPSSVCTT